MEAPGIVAMISTQPRNVMPDSCTVSVAPANREREVPFSFAFRGGEPAIGTAQMACRAVGR
jgi:hypothetical protein